MASHVGKQFAKLPSSNKLALGALLLSAIAALYYVSLHTSVSEALEAARSRQQVLRGDLASAQQLEQQFLQLREELKNREVVDEENMRVLPASSEIATFLEDLNRLAELSGLDIRSVQPRPESQEEFYVRIPVGLQVSGRYHQLAKFFHNISRLKRAINIENISMQLGNAPQAEQDDGVLLSVSVLATTFRRKSVPEST